MLLDVRNTDKKFNGVYALKDLNFSLDAGEIHGLVGENGAGKSTFIKILGGVYKRDGGSILWDGKELPEAIRPEESRNLGINIIFQDNVLIPAFTGAENICLGRPYPVKGGLIRWKKMEREAEEKAAELGIRLDLKKPVSAMTPAQKKCVEIVRAMMSDCKLLILDEPTASLSDKETKLLFSIVRNLKAKGTSVLYVTHRLEEIMELTDRVTVLRNGMLVSTVKTEETSRKELVRLMSGNEAADGVDGSEEHGITEREDPAEKNAGQSVRAGEAYCGEGRNADGCDAQDIGKTEKQVGNGTVTAPEKLRWKSTESTPGTGSSGALTWKKNRTDHRYVRTLWKRADGIPRMHLRNEKAGGRHDRGKWKDDCASDPIGLHPAGNGVHLRGQERKSDDPVFYDRGKYDALFDRPLYEKRVVPETGRRKKSGGDDRGAKDQMHGRRAAGKGALGRKPAESRLCEGTPHGTVDLDL